MFGNGDLLPRKGVLKEEKFPHTQKPSHKGESWEGSRTSESSKTVCAQKAKQRKFTTEIMLKGTIQLIQQRSAHTLIVALESGEWVQRLGFQGSDLRKRTGVDCHEDTVRGLV